MSRHSGGAISRRPRGGERRRGNYAPMKPRRSSRSAVGRQDINPLSPPLLVLGGRIWVTADSGSLPKSPGLVRIETAVPSSSCLRDHALLPLLLLLLVLLLLRDARILTEQPQGRLRRTERKRRRQSGSSAAFLGGFGTSLSHDVEGAPSSSFKKPTVPTHVNERASERARARR